MRVTGGCLRGRLIRVPGGGGVRPTQDRVRAALFSILGGRVAEGRFLDLFAGSGAVGIEAWSRGARRVCWMESDRRVVPVLRENVENLCGGGSVIPLDAVRNLKKGLAGEQFDIIFADPPYGKKGGQDWLPPLLDALADGTILAPGGLFIIEQRVGAPLCAHEGWRLVGERVYGDTLLRMLERSDYGHE